ncbi:hypothetical protein ACFL3D_05480 [Candidatus Omnitrophota bacterium]
MTKTILEEKIAVNVERDVTINAVIGYHDNSIAQDIFFIFPPHPSLGGDYDNNVVSALYQGVAREGYVAVRFNYRGVDSGRVHDEHFFPYWERLESTKEYDLIIKDTETLVKEIRNNIQPNARIHFIAYSFGNFIALELMSRFDVQKFFGISPPIEAYDFEACFLKKRNCAFAVADDDIFCNKERMQVYSEKYNFPLTVIETEDHFYRGVEEQLFLAAKHAMGI